MNNKNKIVKIVNNNAIIFVAIFFCVLFLLERHFLKTNISNFELILSFPPVAAAAAAAKAAQAAKAAKTASTAAKTAKAAKAANTAKKANTAAKTAKAASNTSKSTSSLQKALSNKNKVASIAQGSKDKIKEENTIIPNDTNIAGETADTFLKVVKAFPIILVYIGGFIIIVLLVLTIIMMIYQTFNKYEKFIGYISTKVDPSNRGEMLNKYFEENDSFKNRNYIVTPKDKKVFDLIIDEYNKKKADGIEIDPILIYIILSKEDDFKNVKEEHVTTLSENMITILNMEHICIEHETIVSQELVKKLESTDFIFSNIILDIDTNLTCSYENQEIYEYIDTDIIRNGQTRYAINKYKCVNQSQTIKTYEKKLVQTTESDQYMPESECTFKDEKVYMNQTQYSENKLRDFLLTSNFLTDLYGDTKPKEELIEEIFEQKEQFDRIYSNSIDLSCSGSGNVDSQFLNIAGNVFNTPYSVSSYFGMRKLKDEPEPRMHNGIDLTSSDWSILAIADGVVIKKQNENCPNTRNPGDPGCILEIKHEIGSDTYITRYLHLEEGSIPTEIKLNGKVSKGDLIGIMGNSGYSFGYHLHFGIKKKIGDKLELVNPGNLFVNATNFENKCNFEPNDECSYESIIAAISKKNNFNYKLVNVFYNKPQETTFKLSFRDSEFVSSLSTNDLEILKKDSKIKIENNKIYYDNKIVDNNLSQSERNTKIFEISKSISRIYDYVNMGIFQIDGSEYRKLRYGDSNLLYSTMASSKEKEVSEFFELIKTDEDLVKIFEKEILTDSDFSYLENIMNTKNIKTTYQSLENISVYQHINSCFKSYLSANWGCVFESQYCTPYKEVYKELDPLLENYKLSEKEKFLINIAKELDQKVISCDTNDCDNLFNFKGVNNSWSSKYAGLNNGAYITWVLNQVTNTVNNEFVHNSSGACNVNTSNTRVESLSKLEHLRPGMVLCNQNVYSKSAIMFLGNNTTTTYYISSSNVGVEIKSMKNSDVLGSYKKYFVIDY